MSFPCLGVWVVAAVCCAAAGAENPRTAFLKKYGPAVQKVQATPTPTDDLFLARTFLTDADAQPPETAAMLCRQAYDLTQGTPNGYDLAVEAMEQLAELDPAQDEACLEHIFVLRKKQYDSVGGRKRFDVGRELIDVLTALAEYKAAQGQKDEAEMFLRQAMAVSHATRGDRRRQIEERLRRLPRDVEAGKQRRTLQALLQSDPNDTAARADLVRLSLVYFDDPAAAEALLTPDLDETLRSYVPLVRRAPDSLPPEVAEEMAAWLTTLARGAPADRQAAVLRRARRFLNRVLSGLDENSEQHRHAADALRALDRQLASLGATVGGRRWSLNAAELGLVATPSLNRATQKAQAFLFSVQQPDGAWLPDRPNPMGLDRTGMTALVTYALLQSGLDPRHPQLRRTLSLLRNEETIDTQALAFRCGVWALCRRDLGRRYDRLLRRDAETLYRSSGNGGWEATADVNQPARRGDAYYTQWATLALATASAEGVAVPRAFWSQNRAWWRRGQNDDGGWGRRIGRLSRPFFTVAGAASLLIDADQIGQLRAEALADRSVQRALVWVDQNFDANEQQERQLFLFTLARLGAARGAAKIGEKNWHAWAARELLHAQQPDGAWRPDRESPLASTALNLMTLGLAQGGR